MTCSSCRYLKEDKKYDGALCGAKYYCEKIKDYVDGSNCCCGSYEKGYSRSNYKCDEIFNDGNNFSDDDRPLGHYFFIIIMITVFGLILTFLDKFMY